ncbi:MAG: CPBP family intramembrane glutamic endopeptidase [Chloroflexota bacterium]
MDRTHDRVAPAASRDRAIPAAVGAFVVFLAVSTGATLLLDRLTGLDGKARDLVVEAVLAAVVLGLVGTMHWWRSTGFSTPLREWRNLRLLALPMLLTLVPFAGGFKGTDAATFGVLVVGYALNSVAEDGMFRGIIPRILRSRGLVTAVVLSSLLFGLAHLGNLVSRPDQSVAVTAAQSLGAFTQGIGLVAVRLAMDTLWPVMVIHFLGDLFGQLGGLPVVAANVIESVAMLLFGVWILRRHRGDMERALRALDPADRRSSAVRPERT